LVCYVILAAKQHHVENCFGAIVTLKSLGLGLQWPHFFLVLPMRLTTPFQMRRTWAAFEMQGAFVGEKSSISLHFSSLDI
jgi:hypothetical protein